MADFICFEADASDDTNDEDDNMSVDDEFIDDNEQNNDNAVFFRFHNQTTDIDQILREAAEAEQIAAEHLEANN